MTEGARAVLLDLLMAVMDSPAIWAAAAGDERRGLLWRDAVTRRITASPAYVPYEELVRELAGELALPGEAASELFDRWPEIEPWPDSAALARLAVPYAFVTNCSKRLAELAAGRSRLSPRFVLSAEEAGWYKPDPRIYHDACRRLGSPPDSTLFVAGSAYDADGAAAAGLQAVFVARRPGDRPSEAAIAVTTSLDPIVSALRIDERPRRS